MTQRPPSDRIEILPHDPGTFLVQSRSNHEDYHMVDLTGQYPECSCIGQQTRKADHYRCWHIRHLELILGKLACNN